ncbi:MAG: GreA/GreB family elongation factor [Armatimonadetes bacterium]|nr:GreA/GreB family elongation factor [Armatimonadota bacterium]
MDRQDVETSIEHSFDYLEAQNFAGPVYLTPTGYARLHDELDHLTTVRRTEIADRLRDSKDHGEFSEDNQELDEAKFEQKLVEDRINELKSIFAQAQILDMDTIPTDEVSVGSVVSVKDEDRGIAFDIRIVASIEANPDDDLISEESPMGIALMGAKKGATVEFQAPVGKLKYKVTEISR